MIIQQTQKRLKPSAPKTTTTALSQLDTTVALCCPSPQKELRSAGSYVVWLVCLARLARLALVAQCLTPPPQCYSNVSVCVLLVQSRAVRRCRGLDSAVQTLSPGDKDPPVLVRFMRTLISHGLICAHALSACHNLFTLHLSPKRHLTLVPHPHPLSPPTFHFLLT